jgi:hypothetical protein
VEPTQSDRRAEGEGGRGGGGGGGGGEAGSRSGGRGREGTDDVRGHVVARVSGHPHQTRLHPQVGPVDLVGSLCLDTEWGRAN